MKTYTGDTGYVYQYYFVGKREALSEMPEAPAIEYLFDVTRDRQSFFAVSIFVQHEALISWAESHGRELSDTEQYAAAKMALFRSFDSVEDLEGPAKRFCVRAGEIEELTDALGLE